MLQFEWDVQKARANQRKHQVSFEEKPERSLVTRLPGFQQIVTIQKVNNAGILSGCRIAIASSLSPILNELRSLGSLRLAKLNLWREDVMKPSVIKADDELVEIPTFDFDHSRPNKFAERYVEGVETTILDAEDKTQVMLEPDVAAYFPDSESVNAALRTLIDAFTSVKKSSQKAHM